MFCIKCFSKSTSVINSRPHKRSPDTWRRRKCRTCAYTFSTLESVILADYLQVSEIPFSIPRLTVSLASVLNDDEQSADTAYWLARTVGEKLLMSATPAVTLEELKTTAHDVLRRYDPNAGMRYGLKYGLITASARPRRGRPMFTRP